MPIIFDPAELEFYKDEFKRTLGEERYHAIDPDIIEDYAKMAAFMKPENIAKHVGNFSKQLEEELQEKGLIEGEGPSKSIKKKTGKDYVSNYKVMSELIGKWAKDNGFNQGGLVNCLSDYHDGKFHNREVVELPPMMPILYAELGTDAFRLLLYLGYLFKDVGVTAIHGEWTHIWGILSVLEENREHRFLKHDPLFLYKLMGTSLLFEPNSNNGIWFIIFDLVSETLKKLNAPEILNDALTGGRLVQEMKADEIWDSRAVPGVGKIQEEAWALSEVITGRAKKRIGQTTDKLPSSAPTEAVEKIKGKKTGLFVGGIHFPTDEPRRDLKYDGVFTEFDVSNADKTIPLPSKINSLSHLEQMIYLFDPNNWPKKNNYSKEEVDFGKAIVKILQNHIQKPTSPKSKFGSLFKFTKESKEEKSPKKLFRSREFFKDIDINISLFFSDSPSEHAKRLINTCQQILVKHDQKEIAQYASKNKLSSMQKNM